MVALAFLREKIHGISSRMRKKTQERGWNPKKGIEIVGMALASLMAFV